MAKKGNAHIHLPDKISIAEFEKVALEMQSTANLDIHEIDDQDIDKTLFILKSYNKFSALIKDHEIGKKYLSSGLTAHEAADAEGYGRFEHGQEINSDVTANTVILSEKRIMIVSIYRLITNICKCTITNISDPYEQMIAKKLFLDGERFSDCQLWFRRGYSKTLPSIAGTVFAVRRKQALDKIARQLKLLGILDFIIIREGYRTKKREFAMLMPEWNGI